MTRHSTGQTMIEFLLSSGLVALVVTGAGWLLHIHWEKSKCAYIVFEKTHARLMGIERKTLAGPEVRFAESPQHVMGEASCTRGGRPERVRLKKLKEGLW